MKHLTIVIPAGDNNISSITGTYEIFRRVDNYWKDRGNKQLFTIQLAGTSNETEYSEGLFTVKPHTNISAIAKTNLIIIPS
ncbi:MAG: AraC family transcriptional regulator, partial [Chitinophagaceae bacterium]|nr:AraC family transcriptional regulator [Chitinophagaceae bacterium]